MTTPRVTRRGSWIVAVAVAAVSLFSAASATAQITLGQLKAAGDPTPECTFGESAFDEAQLSISSGPSYLVPSAGVITSWSTAAGPAAGQTYGLKVFRPLAGAAYSVVGQDRHALIPGVLNTFPAAIPVAAGDLIGISVPTNDAPVACYSATNNPGDVVGFAKGNAANGGRVSLETEEEVRLNVAATLLPPPTISAISPGSGSIAGAPVRIAGTNFAAVTGVAIGGVPAAFAIDSEGQITATAPPSATLASVPVTVTTAAGVAGAPVPFTYEGCAVPKLKGKRLKASKRVAAKGGCGVGKVTRRKGATAKRGRVVRQKPAPGAVLAPGTRINVTLK